MKPPVTPEVLAKLHDPLPTLGPEEKQLYKRQEVRLALVCIAVGVLMIAMTIAAQDAGRRLGLDPNGGSSGRGDGLEAVWGILTLGLIPYGLYRLVTIRWHIAQRARNHLALQYEGLLEIEHQRWTAAWRKIGIKVLILAIIISFSYTAYRLVTLNSQ